MSAHDVGIHLPPPSKWPIILAAGISMIFIGLIFRQAEGAWHNLWYTLLVGVVVTVVSIYSWAFEPGH